VGNPISTRFTPHFGRLPAEQLMQAAKEMGLDALDLPRITPEWKKMLDDAGLVVGSVDAQGIGQLFSTDASKRQSAVDGIKGQFENIATCGGKVIFMCLVPENHSAPRAENFSLWKDVFPHVVEAAEQNDLYIAIEGWPGPGPYYPTLGCTPEMWRAMFKEIPSKHFGLNYDPSHLVRLGIDHMRALSEFIDRIYHCHGKDTVMLPEELYASGNINPTFGTSYGFSEGSWRYCIPGEGTVDWKKVAFRLQAAGYQGAVGVELEDHRYWGSLEAEQKGISRAVAHLKQAF